MQGKENFSDFTNLYEISKTLRFELKPVGQTLDYLKNDGVIEKDREVEKNYKEIKIYFDKLHQEFVKQSFSGGVELSKLEDFYNVFLDLNANKKDKKLKDAFNKEGKELKKEFVSFFTEKGNEWKEKYNFFKKGGLGVLEDKEVLQLMSEFYPEQKELFDRFDKFFTYFSNFKESRKNFYADDGRAGAIATRAIDENLITFIKNVEDFKNFQKNFPNFTFTKEEQEIFKLDYYNNCILQEGIDNYNKILGGISENTGNKIQGINEKINLFKQKQTHSNSKDIKFPRFKLLYKQILSDKEKISFIETLEDDKGLESLIFDNKNINLEKIKTAKKLINRFLSQNEEYDLQGVYLSKQAINTISNKYFGNWDFIKEKTDKLGDFVNFAELKAILNGIKLPLDNIFKDDFKNMISDQKSVYENFLIIFNSELNKTFDNIGTVDIKAIKGDFKKSDEKQVKLVKDYFDNMLLFYAMTKYFALEKGKKKIENLLTDNSFYNYFDEYYIDFDFWKEYNLARNYITKKQIKVDKFKLNFDNSQFLMGWDKDKEKERLGVILKKDGLFYLGILKDTKVFDNLEYTGGEFYEKMNYKQLNNVYRQLPRLMFPLQKKLQGLKGNDLEKYLSKYRENFGYNNEIAKIKEEFDVFQEGKEKGEKFDTEKLKKLIKYYQNGVLYLYSDLYDLEEIRGKEYYELAPFYDDIERKMYFLDFSKIDENFVSSKVEEGSLYLFQIYNKDFSKDSKGKENIHTKYFKLLFDEENLQNLVIKLSGGAEVFFRDKTKDLKKKQDKKGKEILDHKRYAEDKIMFHISITLNANAGDEYYFNKKMNEYLKNNQNINIIGIDRGEKNLVYYSVIDRNGRLLKADSLNIINQINYLEKLEKKEINRSGERASWGEIENIKELKNGYISQVVNKLVDLIIEWNAIIIFEDLNLGFKRGRQKIERQIYQKLELALAKKLNYLTKKDKKNTEPLGYLKALQLAPKVNDYQDIGNYKQSGIMFYVNPSYTSQTCPICGFRKNIKSSDIGDTKEKQKKFFKNTKIIFDSEKFIFNDALKSNVLRLKYNTKNKKVDRIDINEGLKKLFKDFNLKGNLNIQILDKDAEFYKSLTYYFNLILQLRNSDSKKGIDYISCPSCAFHSDNGFQGFEFNGDANGAYNIARKGIIVLNNIKVNPEKPNLYISDKDWDEFLENNNF